LKIKLFLKGAVIGGLVSLGINMWLNIGALIMNRPLPTLPPTSINGCQPLTSAENATWMLSTMTTSNDGYFTPSYFYDGNITTSASSTAVQEVGMTAAFKYEMCHTQNDECC
jgi:hypothetical protein